MSKLVGIAACALLISAGTASAQGSFGGFYVGGVLSKAFDGPSSTFFDDHIGVDPPLSSGSSSATAYGVQAGYNYQFGQYVVGVEGDWSRSNSDQKTAILDDGGPGIDSASAKLRSLGSVRGRFGFVPVDNVFVFGTVGVGFGRAEYRFADADEIAGVAKFRTSDTAVVYGGGFDFLLTPNIVLSAEYLRYEFNDDKLILSPASLNGASDVATSLDAVDTLRVAVSYKFDGLALP